jgi:hypothetical protein
MIDFDVAPAKCAATGLPNGQVDGISDGGRLRISGRQWPGWRDTLTFVRRVLLLGCRGGALS